MATDGQARADRAGERRRAELLASALDQMPVGVAVLDTDLRVLAASAALFGPGDAGRGPGTDPRQVPADGVQLPWLDGVHERLAQVVSSGRPLVTTLSAEPAAGSAPRLRAQRLQDADGTVIGLGLLLGDGPGEGVRAGQARLDVLDDAARRIGSTLDLATTAREVVDVAVPAFADHAAVDLVDDLLAEDAGPPARAGPAAQPGRDGLRLRRLARAGARSGAGGGAELGDRFPPADAPSTYGEDSLVAAALGRRGTVLVGDVDGGTVRRLGRDEEFAELALAVGLRSLILVPLAARGTVLGLASFARSGPGPPFDEQDVRLAEELCRRAALAIDNARVYSRERATAVALQESLLPSDEPDLDGVRVAHRYLPGRAGTGVGGDWFDVIALAGGRVALVVGDVMGRGLRAAAAMGQLRTAVRTLAVLDLMPEDVLGHLDDLAQTLDQVQLATCVYAVYDPVTRQLRYATAGHAPPVLLGRPDGPALLANPSGAPLGVGGVPFDSAVLEVPDGSRLVLYTDGLVESRGHDIDAGIALLVDALRAAPDDLEELCDGVLAAMGRDVGHDDVVLLAARLEGVSPQRCTSWRVHSDLEAVSLARHLTRDRLLTWGLGALVDTAELLVSELVTNAIRYATEPVDLRLLLLGDRVEVAVADSDARLPRLRRAGTDDEGGRGLHLVGILARRWGARSTPSGKVVWFDLPLP